MLHFRSFLTKSLIVLALLSGASASPANFVGKCANFYARLRFSASDGKPIRAIEPFLSEGKSESYIVVFEDGSRALFKPDQERNFAGAEVAASALDTLLGFHMVPRTLPRSIKTGLLSPKRAGSLQDFIIGAQGSASEASFALS